MGATLTVVSGHENEQVARLLHRRPRTRAYGAEHFPIPVIRAVHGAKDVRLKLSRLYVWFDVYRLVFPAASFLRLMGRESCDHADRVGARVA